MNVIDTLKLGIENVGKDYHRHKPLILTIVAGGSSLLALYAMYKEGPKIKEGVSKAKEEFKSAETGKDKAIAVVEGAMDVALSVAKVAIPETVAIASMTESYKESSRRILTLGTMLAASQTEIFDIKQATRDIVGKKKATEIEEKVAEKQMKGIHRDELEEFNDADTANPDVIEEPITGCVWRDSYINALNAIASYYTKVKTGSEIFYPISLLYDEFDSFKNGNYIRRGKVCNDFGFMQDDLKDIDSCTDFMELVQAGPGKYKLVMHKKMRPDPDGWIDNLGRYYDTAGQDLYDTSYDDDCGDGDWNNNSLNPYNRK